MKHIITIIAIAIVTLTSCNKKYDEYGLNCKVKSVRVQSYAMVMKFGEPTKDQRVQNELLEFNNGQLITKNVFYDYESDEPELMEKMIYKYNEQGLLIEINEYWGNGSYCGKETYEYNDQNLRTEEYWYNSDDKVSHHYHMEYDETGNEILWVSFNADGTESSRHEHTYNTDITNENGLEFYIYHDEWGYVTYEYVTFDKKGNWTKRIAHNPETNESLYITERKINY